MEPQIIGLQLKFYKKIGESQETKKSPQEETCGD